jgi:uncharacterized protein YeaO (DUF488 family)
MKRDPRLHGLSSDHHRALALARALRAEGATLAGVMAELEPHFRIEEDVLLPALDAAGERALADRVREDHAFLRTCPAPAAFAARMADHVRFEERELFPRCEAVLDGAVLDEVARRSRAANVQTRRAYEAPADGDGYRVLVERLWPRGIRKDALKLDAWARDVAPSAELRKWFAHDVAKWDAFVERYREELGREPAAAVVRDLGARALRGPVTLVYAARDPQHNSASVLRAHLIGG